MMFFKQRVNDDGSTSYFFGCGGQGRAVAVDVVAGDETWYVEQARTLNVTLATVLDTHLHADHLSGGVRLAKLVGAEFAMHESNLGKLGYAFTPLADAQEVAAGNLGRRAAVGNPRRDARV